MALAVWADINPVTWDLTISRKRQYVLRLGKVFSWYHDTRTPEGGRHIPHETQIVMIEDKGWNALGI